MSGQKYNWVNEEKLDLIKIIRKYVAVIECKETNARVNMEKNEAWELILQEYNTNRDRKRTLPSIKDCWRHQKTATRKNHAFLTQETYRTGGGVNVASLNELDVITLGMIQSLSVEGMENPFDCDAVENTSPNCPIFENLIEKREIYNWSKCRSSQLKSPLSPPLEQAIAGTSNIHVSQTPQTRSSGSQPENAVAGPSVTAPKKAKRSEPSLDSYNSTKAEVFNLMKESLTEKKGLEKKLLQKQIKREDLQLKLLKRKLQESNETFSTSESD